MPKTLTTAPPTVPPTDDIGVGLYAIGKSIEGISDELGKMYYVEQLADHAGKIASAMDSISQALAASVIAEHGSDEDRAAVVEHLKGWFWASGTFNDR